jgi:hypothetical protein
VVDIEPFVIEIHAAPSALPRNRLLAVSGTGTGTFTDAQFRDTP